MTLPDDGSTLPAVADRRIAHAAWLAVCGLRWLWGTRHTVSHRGEVDPTRNALVFALALSAQAGPVVALTALLRLRRRPPRAYMLRRYCPPTW